jgi:uncharacterized protein YyaL (SSP411 family)
MKNILYVGMAALILLATSCSKDKIVKQRGIDTVSKPDTTPTTSAYLAKAKKTHEYINNNLLTSYGSYRVNTSTDVNSAFEWYNASQIYADAAMIASGDASYLPKMNATFKWLDNLWDNTDPHGGYFAFAHLDGSGSSGTKYVDDNSLTGMVFLDAYDVTTGTDKAAYLAKAEACADWLMNSGLWDNTYGGGFWWNTEKPNKPTQTNGVALQLFSKLYKITGQTYYHDWAVSINTWLNSTMLDTNTGLYYWMIDNTGKKHSEIFTYDNAIMIEAFLLYKDAMNDNTYLAKAQALGNAMIATLWNSQHNVFIFNTADIRVNGAWCGWASQGMIKLYEADHNTNWLTYAKANIDGINLILLNPANNGYLNFASVDGSGKYTNYEGVDQAWMERVEVMLSKYK